MPKAVVEPCRRARAARRPHHAAPRRTRRTLGAGHDRGGADRRRQRPPTPAGEPVLCSAAAATSWSPTTGFAGTVVEIATRGRHRRRRGRRPDLRRRAGHRRRRRDLGRPGRARPSSGAGSASRRSPASPAWSAPPRSRTSAPTARRSPRPSPRCGCGTAVLQGVRTFANADCGFGYRTSRFKADPGRHVVLDVTFQLRQRRPRRPGAVRRARRALSASSSAQRAPLADVREAVLGAAPQQGHGARPRRPRHLERRLVLHQPGRRRRGRRTGRTRPPGRSPTAG